MSSSQSRCSLRQRSCSSFFAKSVKGAMKPRGSKIDETVDKIPCLVNGLLLTTIQNPILSDCMRHCIPKARSTRRLPHLRAMDLTSLDRSSTGIDSRIARWLEVNLVRQNPPFLQDWWRPSINSLQYFLSLQNVGKWPCKSFLAGFQGLKYHTLLCYP